MSGRRKRASAKGKPDPKRTASGTQPAIIKVAEATTKAWSQANISNADSAVGLRVLAGLLLIAQQEPQGGDPGRRILNAGDEEIAETLDGAWCRFAASRPELAFRCGPFGQWLDEEPRDAATVAAAAATARAAVKAGLFDLVLGPSRARQVDVLGHCNFLLQDKGAVHSRGQFNTPASVAEAVAGMALGTLRQDRSLIDSYAGTGGLLRAAAAELREAGETPHDFRWYGCDVDPVLVAALAVNVHIWDLGPRVLLGCADAIMEPRWQVRAAEEQHAAVQVRDGLTAGVRLLAVAKAAQNPDRGKR